MKKIYIVTKFGATKIGIPLKQGHQNSNFNHLCWTDEIFKIGKGKEKIKFAKFGGTLKRERKNSNFLMV